jgi:hypothetical protein
MTLQAGGRSRAWPGLWLTFSPSLALAPWNSSRFWPAATIPGIRISTWTVQSGQQEYGGSGADAQGLGRGLFALPSARVRLRQLASAALSSSPLGDFSFSSCAPCGKRAAAAAAPWSLKKFHGPDFCSNTLKTFWPGNFDSAATNLCRISVAKLLPLLGAHPAESFRISTAEARSCKASGRDDFSLRQ